MEGPPTQPPGQTIPSTKSVSSFPAFNRVMAFLHSSPPAQVMSRISEVSSPSSFMTSMTAPATPPLPANRFPKRDDS